MDPREKAISDFIGLVKSWIPWHYEPPCVSRDFWMPDESCRVCYDCDSQFTVINRRHHCRICGRVFCAKCTSRSVPIPCESSTGRKEGKKIRVCNYCFKQWQKDTSSFNVGFHMPIKSPSVSSFSSSKSSGVSHYRSLNFENSLNRRTSSSVSYASETDDVANKQHCEESGKSKDDGLPFLDSNDFTTRSDGYDEEYGLCCSDSDTAKFVDGNCCYSQLSDSEFGESHQASPNRKFKSFEEGIGHAQANNEGYTDDEAIATNSIYSLEDIDSEPVDFENNAVLWLPPEPEDEEDEKSMLFYDEEDDNYSSSMSAEHGEEQENTMKDVVGDHFRALVGQLLQVENVPIVEEDGVDSWLDIITRLSWEAATLLKPDMSKSAGMDPGGYVKVKCVASGCRSESMVVKGVVCKKNVAHRRMISMIEKPRILILGGAIEYQRVTNHLSSLDTLLQQEIDYLKMAVAKIDAQQPDVLLVEKSVSRFAQDCILAKGISLVLNIKRPLLERIARCSGTHIVPSIDHLCLAKLGYCEKLCVKRFFEDLGSAGQGGKKLAKNLMYFQGCPKPFGFTILLRGANGDELKKVKHVVQYGVFAAYHLAVETSFLADEGASLPDQPFNSPITVDFFVRRSSTIPSSFLSSSNHFKVPSSSSPRQATNSCQPPSRQSSSSDLLVQEEFPPSPSDHQSILVSLSSRCVWKGSVCEKAHLFRIKYYGTFDKPLGRFLRDHLFDQAYTCHACEMPSEAHVYCYTHRQGTLTISVKKLPEMILPGEGDGKIWMWHRCLKCPRTNNFPPATRRVVMSDAAWGLSFGKFLELSFSNHASASRVASCGHSLHRDCLRFYGFGNMVACFRYASIDVLSVCVPPSKLEFACGIQHWIDHELLKVVNQAEALFCETRNALTDLSERKVPDVHAFEEILQKEISEFGDLLNQEDQMVDILEINKLQRQLLCQSSIWDRRLRNLPRCGHASNSDTDDEQPEIDGADEELKQSLSSMNWKSAPERTKFTKEIETKQGARLMLPVGVYDTVVPVYDDEPTSVISYALTLPAYQAQLTDEGEPLFSSEPVFPVDESIIDFHRSTSSVEESLLSMSSSISSVLIDPVSLTKALHVRISFEDDGPLGKVRYSVTCYYAKRFDTLRKQCCPSEIDFIRSLSRCKKWGAQGGKSNVFFAKTLDDRLIIKQVTKTELDSFVKFAPEYFKYLSESMATRSPTCLAKILGIFQVSARHGKGGKETKRDLLVMENLLFDRKVMRVYDLKGSSRSRYNADVSGANKVLLDQNLMEAMPTSPIFVGNKAKRLLERAVWNDTSFLASVDVMDYSLLVGVDEEKHELVVGIIDFMRQYTWDKHLETWVKTTGILGGTKNTSPTVISPMHYKKRFRKAMTAYFLMVPHQWSQ